MGRQAQVFSHDVIVIGAGIIGAALAFRLQQAGLSVGVIEREDAPAMHSTAKSAAGVRVQFGTEANILLSWESIQEYRSEQWQHHTDYRPVGYLFLVPEEQRQLQLAGVALQQQLGAPVKVLTPGEAQKHIAFHETGVAMATFGPADGIIDPHRTTMAYVAQARELGATFYFGHEVMAMRHDTDWRVSCPHASFRAPIVVNAAGAWAGNVALKAGFTLPIEPSKRPIYTTGPVPGGHTYPLTIDVASGFYLRSEGERIIFGRSNPNEVPGFTTGVDFAWLDETLEVGLRRFPWLAEVGLDRKASWWGYYEVTPDDHPILGFMPNVPGWVNACGFSGHGVQQAAAVARVLTEEIQTGRAHSINIDELRFERFAAGGTSSERLAI